MIICSNLKCKYHSDNEKCKHKKIILNLWSVATKNMGYKDFLECKSFEYDKEYLELSKKVEELLKEEI